MGKYKKLIFNTLLFGVASFSSKFLTIFISMVLTRLFTRGEYSTSDIVISTCNFIVPIISLCMHEAVIRFGLDKGAKKSDVFTTAIMTIFTGYAILLLGLPLMRLNTRISGYLVFIYLYVLTSALRSTVTHFVRASGFLRVFAIDGVITTLTTVGFTCLFILGFKMRVEGYLGAIILADAISSIWQIAALKLHRFFKPRQVNILKSLFGKSDRRYDPALKKRREESTTRQMLRYSIPLVPTAIFWWITNLSDRYLVDYLVSPEANGLYALSYKIPNMITLVSAIFTQAWQISAFSEYESEESIQFYSTVFTSYQTLIFLATSGLILIIKPVMGIIGGKEFFDAWRYVPFLVLAVAFSCLVTFLGTIYNAAKSNAMVTVTTFVGAFVNIVLNLILIPKFGPNGAAFATFFSFFIVFIIRVVDTRRYLPLQINAYRIAVSLCLLLVQIWAALFEVRFWVGVEILIFLLLAACNWGSISYVIKSARGELPRRKPD